MAKLTGIFQFKGKLGTVIGRRNQQRQLQSTIERHMNVVALAPSAVSNPKTTFQASQRMRMRAAVNFYRQIGFILNHSWQGTRYKSPSRNRFMQIALRKGDFAIPFLEKGSTAFVPGEYPVSEGGLVGVHITGINNNWVYTNLAADNNDMDTIAEISSIIINNNAGFYNGDKLTFIFVLEQWLNNQPLYNAVSIQFILDTTNNTEAAEVEDFKLSIIKEGGTLAFSLRDFTPGVNQWIKAAAIIQVRAPQSQGGSTAWQRSTASMFVHEDILSRYMSAEAFNAAIATYQQDNADVNSDWYLNTGAENEGGTSGNNSQPEIVGQFSIPSGGPITATMLATYRSRVIAKEEGNSITLYRKVSSNSIAEAQYISGSQDVADAKTQIHNAGKQITAYTTALAGGIYDVTGNSGGVIEDVP